MSSTQNIEKEVRAWIDELLEAWAKTGPGSIEAFIDFLHENFSGFGTGEHDRYVSQDDVREMMQREQSGMPYPVKVVIPWLDVRIVRPDVALAEGMVSLTIQTGEEDLVVETRMTLLGVNQEDTWHLTHFHFSAPDATQAEGGTLLDSLREKNRLLEAEVARRTEELNASLNELKATQAQLVQQEKMASLGALTAGIAHEIKNPLNFVNNFAAISTELIQELVEEEDESARESLLEDLQMNLVKIGEHGQRADNIVRSMLEHSRGSSGERRLVNINRLVKEYAELAKHGHHRSGEQAADVVLELGDDCEIEIVPQEIGRVLLNLIGNALDAVANMSGNPKNGKPVVTISTTSYDSFVEVRVSDNGGGIPEENIDKVFEPFFTTKPTGQGTGLGLSLSYDIVAQGHRGSLALENRPGHGATFVMRLPRKA